MQLDVHGRWRTMPRLSEVLNEPVPAHEILKHHGVFSSFQHHLDVAAADALLDAVYSLPELRRPLAGRALAQLARATMNGGIGPWLE